MAMLDRRFRITKRNPSAPIMHYGFTYTEDNVLHCARHRQLLPPGLEDEQVDVDQAARRLFMAEVLVRKYLESQLQVRIFAESVLAPERPFGMFALYSNYTRRRLRRSDDDEWDILEALKYELNIEEKRQAQWYWDIRYKSRYANMHKIS